MNYFFTLKVSPNTKLQFSKYAKIKVMSTEISARKI